MAGPIETRGVARTTHAFKDVGKRGANIAPAAFKVRTIFRKAEAARFDSQGHGTWPGLADATKERKRQRNQDPRVMRATNALYKSLTAANARDQVDERGPAELRFGTTVPYAGFHNTGKGVPKRALIDLTHGERRRIDEALEAFIATGDRT